MTATDIVTDVAYNVRGQRAEIDYGNNVVTTFEYDARSFRVRRIHTTRPHNDPTLREVQDLRYHYDQVGNITQIRDKAQQGVFFDNAYVSPEQVFSYDPVYRLIEAEGREHDPLTQPTATGFTPINHPQNTQAQRRYVQSCVYDQVGNIKRMKHASGGVTQWHRGYDYASDGNRLLKTSLPGDDVDDEQTYTAPYSYDEHGSMTAISSIPGGLTWDPQDRLQQSGHLGGGDVYYVYDSAGMRARKVWVNQGGTASKERFYLGPWETYRETTDLQGTPTLDLERETLHVDDAAGAACLIETKTVANGAVVVNPTSHLRYQHTNHLGTATLELTGAAEVISYEEYHPYGTSAYRAANSSVDVSAKRYRYTGKERDEETGLYYHEARYYACWLGRWCSSDPIGLEGGMSTFAYVRGNPCRLVDHSGNAPAAVSPGTLSDREVKHEEKHLLIAEEARSEAESRLNDDLRRLPSASFHHTSPSAQLPRTAEASVVESFANQLMDVEYAIAAGIYGEAPRMTLADKISEPNDSKFRALQGYSIVQTYGVSSEADVQAVVGRARELLSGVDKGILEDPRLEALATSLPEVASANLEMTKNRLP